ncbi:MAG: chemotaxis response regulator protein-glutamate methylesterase [Calditrichaeota bacterium]|nr:chemotaxis response regulator protein-glutamate methylesterase [Calditrichota bacterium]MCB9473870.1 chemotaxis response regulator protein-glutamate methylesterase [Candidatus Delongbacteria bacterium]
MDPIRVLIVDDSSVVRRLLKEALAPAEDIVVSGAAPDGQSALDMLARELPDLVTLDVEMPRMDGLTALKEIRRLYPRLPVIMFSTLTERGGRYTIEALTCGANDYVTKPEQMKDVDHAVESIRRELLPRIRNLSQRFRKPDRHAAAPVPASPSRVIPAPPVRRPMNVMRRVEGIAIGVSTGGPEALRTLLSGLPASLPVPVVLVQHMPPLFTRILAERLDAECPIRVREVADGDTVHAGTVYIAPGGKHMVLDKVNGELILKTNDDPPENSCRPAVDVLFRSVSRIWGPSTLAVILTGMGADGREGCRRLAELGAQVLVQDEASSVVWGMPGAVAAAGLAEEILPLDRIAARLVEKCGVGRVLV